MHLVNLEDFDGEIEELKPMEEHPHGPHGGPHGHDGPHGPHGGPHGADQSAGVDPSAAGQQAVLILL